jgi:hypothetical protein
MQSMGYFPYHFFPTFRALSLFNLFATAFSATTLEFSISVTMLYNPPHLQLGGNEATIDISQWTTASGKEQDHFPHEHKSIAIGIVACKCLDCLCRHQCKWLSGDVKQQCTAFIFTSVAHGHKCVKVITMLLQIGKIKTPV